MIKLDDFKNLNPKNPGAWPWLVKIVVFVVLFLAVVATGAWFDWQDQWESLRKAKQEEEKLKDSFLAKKKEAINLDLIRKQLTETQESFGALLKQLPSKSEMDALLTDINQAGLGRGLQFELFRPGAEKVVGSFAEQPITIKVSGSYDDIGKFSSDIAMLPRIVTLGNISISPVGGKSVADARLSMDAIAKTFRYLDETELATQKKAAAPAKKGKKK
ncbi:MAG: pilus assembly protein PilO [Gallionellales bacterium RIFCSPLOWO2_12_FULL_59_22]|nr:MAG: pilus assembly protein PilO [Gallionellales bacterium RIFCSPLOWO2_02_FULL_59_110]OGT05447.1 MAG: pilus assembly protein PilO [Gallionellales bacterium RIFCSPLOWO2_02_58_13]OGT12071.1 MAG: pilus assembly protein PilO [Gallionellales bacterium RIFCSPLOWO2_12_FULL_59_22]